MDKGSCAYNQGVEKIYMGDYLQAIRLFKEAVSQHPKFPEALWNLCVLYSQTEEYETALDYGKKALLYFEEPVVFRTADRYTAEEKKTETVKCMLKSYRGLMQQAERLKDEHRANEYHQMAISLALKMGIAWDDSR